MINKLLTGRVISIDPSSCGVSPIGWAVAEHGVITSSGIITCTQGMNIYERLQAIKRVLDKDATQYDVMILERIRGKMAHEHLKWSIGLLLGSVKADHVVEMPIPTWQKYADKDWVKGDEADAIQIYKSTLKLAKENPDAIKALH